MHRHFSVAQTHVGFGQPHGGNVFAKGARCLEQGMFAVNADPVAIVIVGIVVNGLVGPAMDAGVAVLITHNAFRVNVALPAPRQFVDGAESVGPGVRCHLSGEESSGQA